MQDYRSWLLNLNPVNCEKNKHFPKLNIISFPLIPHLPKDTLTILPEAQTRWSF